MKKILGIILGVVLIVALIIGGFIVANHSGSGSNNEHEYLPVRRIEVKEGENEHGILFNNLISVEDWGTSTTVYGEVINNSNQSYSRILLSVRFYDKNNEFVGNGEGAVRDINAGSTQLFSMWADENVVVNAVSASFEIVKIDIGEYIPRDVVEFSNMRRSIVDEKLNIVGYVENVSSEMYSFAFWIGAYDSQGNLIGMSLGEVFYLDVAEKRAFEFRVHAGNILSAVTFRAFII